MAPYQLSWVSEKSLFVGPKTAHSKDKSAEKRHTYSTIKAKQLTGDRSSPRCDSESKAELMNYLHKTSSSPRKFKVVASARMVLLTIFWDMEGTVHIEF